VAPSDLSSLSHSKKSFIYSLSSFSNIKKQLSFSGEGNRLREGNSFAQSHPAGSALPDPSPCFLEGKLMKKVNWKEEYPLEGHQKRS
jgi:hypothetical protein